MKTSMHAVFTLSRDNSNSDRRRVATTIVGSCCCQGLRRTQDHIQDDKHGPRCTRALDILRCQYWSPISFCVQARHDAALARASLTAATDQLAALRGELAAATEASARAAAERDAARADAQQAREELCKSRGEAGGIATQLREDVQV